MEAWQIRLASCRVAANLLLGSNGGLWLSMEGVVILGLGHLGSP